MLRKCVAFVLVLLFCTSFVFSQDVLERGSVKMDKATHDQYNNYVVGHVSIKDTEHLYIAVTSLSGDADIFVGYGETFPTKENHLWSAFQGASDVLPISPKDSKYRAGEDFKVSIFGRTDSEYGIVAYITTDTIKVLEAFPISVKLEKDTYLKFEFPLTSSDDFTIVATPVFGDPDIYVSTNVNPDKNNHMWSAQEFNYDLVEIKKSDPNFKVGSYFISAYGFSSSQFTLLVARETNTVRKMVADGLPQAGLVAPGQYSYFEFHLTVPGHSLFFEVTPYTASGDPDMFINVGDELNPAELPTADHHTWAGQGFGGDYVHIRTNDANFRTPGIYVVGIMGYVETEFLLSIFTEGNNVVLTSGVPENENVAKDVYTYFKFYHGDTESNLIFKTSSTIGIVETYISKSISKPSVEKHEFKSYSQVGSESVIHIPHDQNTEGWYFVGVLGKSNHNSFTIMATTNQTAQILEDGKANAFNYVPKGHYRYFTFDVADFTKDVSFTVAPFSGDADLYVSNTVSRPTSTEHTWKSTRVGEDSITVHTTDPNYSKGHRFFIGVLGWDHTYFTIIAYLSGQTILLHEDANTPGNVEQNKYQYYKFHVHSPGTILIELTLRTSEMDADFYVGDASIEKPTKQHYKWKSTNFGDDFLRIDDAPSGMYYVGVFGVTDSTYNVRYASQYVELLSSQAVLDSSVNGKYRYYHFDVTEHTQEILIAVTLVNGATELYVSNDAAHEPTRTSKTYAETRFPGNVLLIRKSEAGQNWRVGKWSIGVYAQEHAYYFVSVQHDWGILTEGMPRLSMSTHATPTHYIYFVPYDFQTSVVASSHYVFLDVTHGEANIYISQDTNNPSPQNYKWKSEGPDDHFVDLNKEDLKGGYVYIGVYAESPTARFVLMANADGEPVVLTQDAPQDKWTAPNTASYFSLLTAQAQNSDLSVYVESCDTDIAPTVYLHNTNKKPGPDANIQKSTPVSFYVQHLKHNVTASSVYYLGAHAGKEGASYQIYATSALDLRPFPGNNGTMKGHYSGGKFTLQLHDAYKTVFPHHYRVYAHEYHSTDHDGTDVNMETVCGMQVYGNEIANHTIRSDSDVQSGKDFKIEIPNVDKKKVYAFNVIVESGYGLKSSYKHLWLVRGKIQDHPGPKTGGSKFHVGWFLIGMSLGLIAVYLVAGCIYNYVKGVRGIEMIPNLAFWKTLPFLVWEGVIFTFTCGKGFNRTTYADLDRPAAQPESSRPSGYGSI